MSSLETLLPLASSLANAKGWDEFTRTLMLAGKSLVPLPADKRLAVTEVEGCESLKARYGSPLLTNKAV